MDFALSDHNPGFVTFVTWIALFLFPFVIGVIGVDVCPAVKAPNSNTFISYDFQNQAATLEEAVANFVDPTAQNPFRAPTLYGTFPDGQIRQRCSTLDCLNCYELLSDKLRPFVPNLPGVSSLPNGALLDLKRPKICKNLLTTVSNVLSTNLQRGGESRTLVSGGQATAGQMVIGGQTAPAVGGQRQLGNLNATTQAPSLVSVNDVIRLAGLVDQGQLQNSKTTNSSDISGNSSILPGIHDMDHGFRPKRDAAAPPTANVQTSKLGVRTTLNCKYKKGDPIDADGDQSSGKKTSTVSLAGLCNLCWTLRTLPSRYFPRFLSELSCDDGHPPNGTTCLAGQGTCVERLRQLDVLYNQGSDAVPVWNRQSLGTVSSCECRVPTTSAIYNLVKN